MASSSLNLHNRNPTGLNQYGNVAKADDARLAEALEKYHRAGERSNKTIAQLLLKEYDISMSETTVKRRRRQLGFLSSRLTSKVLPQETMERLVVNEMNEDIARNGGVGAIQAKVALHGGQQIARHIVHDIMQRHDPEGFAKREPTAKRIHRSEKHPLGIHERWAGDGHDKLYSIGFPAWAVVDDATTKGLGAWIVPSNRMGIIIAYLFLTLVVTYGVLPLQFTTDCGSETTQLYGLMNALRTVFFPEYDNQELPAHVYLRSVHNISIERSWLRLRLDFGEIAVKTFGKGALEFNYNDQDPVQYELCQWLWAKLLKAKLADYWKFRDIRHVRKQADKDGPSGMSRMVAFTLPEKWGGEDMSLPLRPDQIEIVKEIQVAMGGDELLEFNPPEYRARAEAVYTSCGIRNLTWTNVWDVFQAMLPLM